MANKVIMATDTSSQEPARIGAVSGALKVNLASAASGVSLGGSVQVDMEASSQVSDLSSGTEVTYSVPTTGEYYLQANGNKVYVTQDTGPASVSATEHSLVVFEGTTVRVTLTGSVNLRMIAASSAGSMTIAPVS